VNVNEFVNGLDDCYDYGRKPGQLALIAAWAQTIPDGRLGKLFTAITETITTEFNQVADIARVKKLYTELCGSMQFAKYIPSNAKQIAQLDEAGKLEIEQILGKLNKKLGIKYAQ
jgi:hypothetical protein